MTALKKQMSQVERIKAALNRVPSLDLANPTPVKPVTAYPRAPANIAGPSGLPLAAQSAGTARSFISAPGTAPAGAGVAAAEAAAAGAPDIAKAHSYKPATSQWQGYKPGTTPIPQAAPAAAAPAGAAAPVTAAQAAGRKFAQSTVGKVLSTNVGTPSLSGVAGVAGAALTPAMIALSQGWVNPKSSKSKFMNDPDVSTWDKTKQFGADALNIALPSAGTVVGTGAGAAFGGVGAIPGAVIGGGLGYGIAQGGNAAFGLEDGNTEAFRKYDARTGLGSFPSLEEVNAQRTGRTPITPEQYAQIRAGKRVAPAGGTPATNAAANRGNTYAADKAAQGGYPPAGNNPDEAAYTPALTADQTRYDQEQAAYKAASLATGFNAQQAANEEGQRLRDEGAAWVKERQRTQYNGGNTGDSSGPIVPTDAEKHYGSGRMGLALRLRARKEKLAQEAEDKTVASYARNADVAAQSRIQSANISAGATRASSENATANALLQARTTARGQDLTEQGRRDSQAFQAAKEKNDLAENNRKNIQEQRKFRRDAVDKLFEHGSGTTADGKSNLARKALAIQLLASSGTSHDDVTDQEVSDYIAMAEVSEKEHDRTKDNWPLNPFSDEASKGPAANRRSMLAAWNKNEIDSRKLTTSQIDSMNRMAMQEEADAKAAAKKKDEADLSNANKKVK